MLMTKGLYKYFKHFEQVFSYAFILKKNILLKFFYALKRIFAFCFILPVGFGASLILGSHYLNYKAFSFLSVAAKICFTS